VNFYTITITADDDRAATTTLRLDTSGNEVRLTDLHLHARNGLSTGRLPAIDYGLLLQAVAPATPTPITVVPAIPAGEVDAAPVTRPEPEPAAGRGKARQTVSAATKRSRAAAPSAPRSGRTGRRAASTAKPAPAEPTKTTRSRRVAANKTAAAPNKTVRSAKKAAEAAPAKKATRAAAGSGGRVYRRMPDDFAAVYQQTGGAAAIAEHYDVPRHTANGWIRRLRDQATSASR
jgi:hypothetical protein